MAVPQYWRADERPGAPPEVSSLDTRPLLGTWHNSDFGESAGILRIELSERAGGLMVHTLGYGRPRLYDWGEVPALPYAQSVAGHRAWAFNAHYRFHFLDVLLAAYEKSGILVMTSYNTFLDGSGRADYWTREFFHRAARP